LRVPLQDTAKVGMLRKGWMAAVRLEVEVSKFTECCSTESRI